MNSVELGKVADVNWGNTSLTKAAYSDTGHPAFSAGGSDGKLKQFEHEGEGVVLSAIGARCGRCFWADGKWTAIKNTITVRPGSANELSMRYAFHFLNRDGIWPRRGGAQPFIALSEARKVKVPLPPLPEQKRIAAILDKADEIRKKRAEAIKLTEELLRSAFLEMFGDPVTNPKGWEVKKLGEVCTFVGGGTPSRAKKEFFTGSIPWATSKDIRGEIFVDSQEHVTQEGIDGSATKLVPPQTLLIVVKSKVLMHRLPVTISQVEVCFGQDLKGILLEEPSLRPEFVLRFLKLSARVLLPRARGANTEGLTLDHLRDLAIPVPDGREIQRYQDLAIRVRRILAASSGEDMEKLSSTLTQRAFRGEL